MSAQKFYASPTDTFTWDNGAVGHRPGGSFDCLGPYAKVSNCPVDGAAARYTCYATGYADSMSSVPACTRIKGRYVSGFFAMNGDNIAFYPKANHKDRVS